MPKNSRQTTTKGTPPYSKRGKGKKKQRTTNRPSTRTSKQRFAPPKSAAAKSIPSTTPTFGASRNQQIAPQPYIIPELKRIGIIAVAMLIILIVLYLVL